MEINQWAMRVFTADCLEEKLFSPEGGLKSLSDHHPGNPIAWRRPSRPSHLRIAEKERRKKFPHPNSLERSEMRARCLHVFANHELMALEMMAWALLAFPQAEPSFRKGLANILLDEQRHFRLYCDRLAGLGIRFGDLPVNDHFWRSGEHITNPLDWVCTMHLTFEQSNLDHAPFFGRLFREVEDHASADLMKVIFEDEIRHVRFGSRWLKHYTPPETSLFEMYAAHCSLGNPPARAIGPEFQEQARRLAGLDEEFICNLRLHQQR
jgi:uncharacterized ferritin-like protein (DUF455 family)